MEPQAAEDTSGDAPAESPRGRATEDPASGRPHGMESTRGEGAATEASDPQARESQTSRLIHWGSASRDDLRPRLQDAEDLGSRINVKRGDQQLLAIFNLERLVNDLTFDVRTLREDLDELASWARPELEEARRTIAYALDGLRRLETQVDTQAEEARELQPIIETEEEEDECLEQERKFDHKADKSEIDKRLEEKYGVLKHQLDEQYCDVERKLSDAAEQLQRVVAKEAILVAEARSNEMVAQLEEHINESLRVAEAHLNRCAEKLTQGMAKDAEKHVERQIEAQVEFLRTNATDGDISESVGGSDAPLKAFPESAHHTNMLDLKGGSPVGTKMAAGVDETIFSSFAPFLCIAMGSSNEYTVLSERDIVQAL